MTSVLEGAQAARSDLGSILLVCVFVCVTRRTWGGARTRRTRSTDQNLQDLQDCTKIEGVQYSVVHVRQSPDV